MRIKSFKFAATAALCTGVTFYAVWAYGGGTQRVPVHPEMAASFDRHRALITIHAVGAAVAMLLGPLQFLDDLRARRPRLHRALGYLYLIPGVAIGGTAGLLLAPYAFGGFLSQLGFGTLAGLWLLTGGLAILAARKRDFADHRRWMTRNFALTLAALMLRIYVPASVAAGVPFETAYPVVAWLCWVPNLVFVEWRNYRLLRTP